MKKLLFSLILFFSLSLLVVGQEQINAKLSRCVDGDTARFIVDDQEIIARFLAIDTPETVHPQKKEEPFGKEASDYTCNKLTNAKDIKLIYDANSNKKDHYNRHLVWVVVDNQLLQEELVEKGLAKVAYLYDDYQYTDLLLTKEYEAKSQKIGIWQDEKNNYPIILLIIFFILLILLTILKPKIKNKAIKKGVNKTTKNIKKQIKTRWFKSI